MCKDLTFADLFAGGGGVTTGALSIPGIKVLWALNHSQKAIKIHARNHPETKHYMKDVETMDVRILSHVDILWASIECTQHSKAKGGGNKDVGSYLLGWHLIRYIVQCEPSVVLVENVPEFVKWAPVDAEGNPIKGREGEEFYRWIAVIRFLGYEYRQDLLNAADYGAPTQRVRYIGVFYKKGIDFNFPHPTHKNSWIPCRDYIDLSDEGQSIFGRKFNGAIPKNVRRPLVHNTLRRIAGGLKKFAPDLFFIMKYYGHSVEGNSFNCHSTQVPLHSITTKDRHALVKVEKAQFIQDYCRSDFYHGLGEPLRPQLTRQTKHFVSVQYSGNGNPGPNNHSVEDPLWAITTREKFQFITTYFNSGGKPESQNQSLGRPLNTILTSPNKKALVTALNLGIIDFDVKMRFLTAHELSSITGFPDGYFSGISKKDAVELIGNAVPVLLASSIIKEAKNSLLNFNIKLSCT